MLDRDLTLERPLTETERRAAAALELSQELRQIAEEAIQLDSRDPQNIREDLRPETIDLATATQMADKLLDERHEVAQKLTIAAQNHHFSKKEAERFPQLKQSELFDKIENEVPLLRTGQRLEFVRMADAADLARAEMDSPAHWDILEQGVPLQSLKGYAIIGLPPGDLERSQDDMADARDKGEPEFAVYKTTNAMPIKEYEL